MEAELGEVARVVADLAASDDVQLVNMARALEAALRQAQACSGHLLAALKDSPEDAMGGSFDFMMLSGYLLGGALLGRSALIARAALNGGSDSDFYRAKIGTAAFYSEHILPRVQAHAEAITGADGALREYPVDWL